MFQSFSLCGGDRPKVLVFLRYFLPGYRSGGPVRSIASLCAHLGSEIEFCIACLDHDFKQPYAYPEITKNCWMEVSNARVMYLTQREATYSGFSRLLAESDFEGVYLNSVFDYHFSITPMMLQKASNKQRCPVLVAPRGEFSPGAMALKSWRKAIYLRASRATGLYRNVLWHATTPEERECICARMGVGVGNVIVAPNLPSSMPVPRRTRVKRRGELRIVFLSRVSKMKNLLFALERVCELLGDIYFDIYGPIDDLSYWRRCCEKMKHTPANIKVDYRGELPHEKVISALQGYDVFFLPTFGENYGHAIFEAMAAGLPVILSNLTPWRDLDVLGFGADLPLDRPNSFRRTLQSYVEMSHSEWLGVSAKASMFAKANSVSDTAIALNRDMFRRFLRRITS